MSCIPVKSWKEEMWTLRTISRLWTLLWVRKTFISVAQRRYWLYYLEMLGLMKDCYLEKNLHASYIDAPGLLRERLGAFENKEHGWIRASGLEYKNFRDVLFCLQYASINAAEKYVFFSRQMNFIASTTKYATLHFKPILCSTDSKSH